MTAAEADWRCLRAPYYRANDDSSVNSVSPEDPGLALVTVAACMLVAEPFPKGAVLVSLTASHGVDAGDLPALGLLLVAGWLAR